MAIDEATGTERTVPLVWIDRDAERILFANQILAQHLDDEFIISFGQVSPPAILGDGAERSEGLDDIEIVPVKTVARIGMPAGRMREFIAVMQQNLDLYEHKAGTGGHDG